MNKFANIVASARNSASNLIDLVESHPKRMADLRVTTALMFAADIEQDSPVLMLKITKIVDDLAVLDSQERRTILEIRERYRQELIAVIAGVDV